MGPPSDGVAGVVRTLRGTFDSGGTLPLEWRRRQLTALGRMMREEEDRVAAALRDDLGKSAIEAYLTESSFVGREIAHTLRNLERWTRPRRVRVPAALRPARARIVRQPLGVVLVIAPWNYPAMLSLAPLVGALAAGNCAVLKPSELAPATSGLLAELLPRTLDANAVAVVEGGVPETTALLTERFDHILFTGSGRVGRIVMEAAAKHPTPVTLELGGKSPAVVEPGVDLVRAARRIVWGKFLNAGQTCVAPDYVLAVGAAARELEAPLADAVRRMFGSDPSRSPDYGRIVNLDHFDRLVGLLGDGRIVVGGERDRNDRYLAPTVLADVDPDAAVMQEEIFGPILPVVGVPDLDAAIAFVRSRPTPLALYGFTGAKGTKRRLLEETASGSVGFGVPAAQMGVSGLPFGGVGASGMGRYHGVYSIDTFSHARAVLDKPLVPDTLRSAYPPIGGWKERLLRKIW